MPHNNLDSPQDRPPLTTVAIGCSAGGVRALQQLFSGMPVDLGVAFVVIMHLHPDHPSDLAQILRRATSMTVVEVEDTVELAPNHVYIISPNKRLIVSGDELSASPFDEPRGQRSPIDQFFRSLGDGHGDGYAIVLSGGGADGSVGLKAIKENGGVILVQDPAEAEFASMPRSAIATGLADFMAPLARMPGLLEELIRGRRQMAEEQSDGDEESIRQILTYLRARTGHDFSRYKRSTIQRRLSRRLQLNRIERFPEYLRFLRENVEEVQALFSELLISVTTFFRDPETFDALAHQVLPVLFNENDETIRVWVPGCATGEEAYSIGMLLLEEAGRRQTRPELQIFATDLDNGALSSAREGAYSTAIEVDVTPERLGRFFTREGNVYRVRKELRDLVVFAHHSLLKDPPFSRLDLVSCRNLLIYLERDLQRQVCSAFHYALRPGRFLLLGSAETADATPGQFRPLDREHRIYQSVDRLGTRGASLPPMLLSPSVPTLPVALPPARTAQQSELVVHLSALEELAPPSILVDQEHRALHLSETAGRFLQPTGGTPSTNISHLLRPELRLDVRAGLHRALDRGETTTSLPISVQFNGSPHRVIVQVRPVSRKEDPPRSLAVVFFIDTGAVGDSDASWPPVENESVATAQLEEELKVTRERLRATHEDYEATNEELRAANEELQSINEEYRSTAEELETSKEELQSMNEELQTLNSELKLKLESVSRAHSDLQNLMSATEVGTLFLDTSLHIKRFTPKLAELFNIAATDEGRSITNFTHQLKYDDLEKDAKTVAAELTPLEREVESGSGRWYLLRMRPYRTLEDKIDGVVVTLVDITERRESERRLRQLTAELDHRVKNVLSRVLAVAERSRSEEQSTDEFIDAFNKRLQSMADTHALLSRAQWSGINIRELVEHELEPYMQRDTVTVTGPDLLLNADAAQAISLVIHELSTNAVKHGALSAIGGKVLCEISTTKADGETMQIDWRETGGPPAVTPQRKSYGLQVIEGLLDHELGASTAVEFAPTGLHCRFVIPLKAAIPRDAQADPASH
ncbi:MAG: chemotaxis protein CheB [Hyphomicrobiaceae bacterium]